LDLGPLLYWRSRPLDAEDTPAWKSCIATTDTGAERFASCSEVIDGKTTARLESLAGVGHLPEMEASDKVNALIRDFFLQ
jgi:hypothetical protein